MLTLPCHSTPVVKLSLLLIGSLSPPSRDCDADAIKLGPSDVSLLSAAVSLEAIRKTGSDSPKRKVVTSGRSFNNL